MIVFGIDLLSKSWAFTRLAPGAVQPVYSRWLQLRLVRNPGATLGMLSGHPTLLIIITAVIGAGVLYVGLIGNGDYLWSATTGTVLGGALGNFYDRVTLGYVRDFIQLRGWPGIFNLADVFIRLGVLVIFVRLLLDSFTKQGKTTQL